MIRVEMIADGVRSLLNQIEFCSRDLTRSSWEPKINIEGFLYLHSRAYELVLFEPALLVFLVLDHRTVEFSDHVKGSEAESPLN